MTTLPQTTPVRVPRSVSGSPLAGPSGAMMAGGAGMLPPPGGLTGGDVMRVIRQNLWLIILAVIAGGICGYLVNNYYLVKYHSRYKTSGLMMVRSLSELPEPGSRRTTPGIEETQMLQATHAGTIMHEGLFLQAMSEPGGKIRETAWFASFQNEADPMAEMKKDLRANLRVTPSKSSRLIEIEMTTSDPKDAKKIIEELGDLHIRNYADRHRKDENEAVGLMTKEKRFLQLELDEEVNKQLGELESSLGSDTVEVSANYNGKRMMLDRMLQERSQINSQLAGLNAQLNGMETDVRDGRTPSEVQTLLSRDGRYLSAKQRLDDMDVEIDQLAIKLGEGHDLVVSYKKRREGYRQKLDEIREELKADYTETYRSQLRNQVNAYNANGNVIDQEIDKLSRSLGDLNNKMQRYRVLLEKERRLRDKINAMEAEIRMISQFRVATNWAQVEWSSKPQNPDFPSFPKLPITMAVAMMLSLALSVGIAFLRELTDTTVRSPRDVAKVGQLTLLGLIPHEQDDPQAQGARLPLSILDAPNSHIAEQFRQIRTRLQYAHSLDTTRSLLITSPSPEDGKSTVACNIAASLALNGRRILLVDANFRRPQLNTLFNVPNEQGFGDALSDLDKMPECVRPTEVPNLSLMVAGTRPVNPTELLESQFFIDFIERALEEFDHVIFDSGPLLMVSESVAMAPRVDGVITVVRARGNSRGLLQRLRDELRKVKADHLGVVLNAVRSQGGGYYGRNIKSYYAYQNA
ncbi:polysaccharide biosynthesis tyrosine autokinase [Humisphaera borealis]|uniref:Polysaccharide biosynthesis tyrosine autokinase n=1 Tax=Humisphaera borealis TaxID=2807512 RepID=A0A7M2WQI4_9BACT|nr:polysaccharide biosynthesis tyrosine autokinase [Humisphaera borealis]QOV87659.1 polysaccharide biosynthesis tyrosine autokinase [Humisphaera borealis]